MLLSTMVTLHQLILNIYQDMANVELDRVGVHPSLYQFMFITLSLFVRIKIHTPMDIKDNVVACHSLLSL